MLRSALRGVSRRALASPLSPPQQQEALCRHTLWLRLLSLPAVASVAEEDQARARLSYVARSLQSSP
jgi:hypothetical protein